MKETYLIRHTTPAVAKGICYGQTDLDIIETFKEEAAIIRQHLPENMGAVHSSPLQRCSRLARHLFPDHTPVLHDQLMEIHCGEWEMKSWDELPKEVIDPWMNDFVNIRIPGGESYLDLHERVTRCFNEITVASNKLTEAPNEVIGPAALPITISDAAIPDHPAFDTAHPATAGQVRIPAATPGESPIAIVAHGGVIRSILSHLTGTPLIDSFKVFSLHYGCVIRIFGEPGSLHYEILSNLAPAEKEQHKPRSFYK